MTNIVSLKDDKSVAAGADMEALMTRYKKAQSRRSYWEQLWDEAYNYALPQRDPFDDNAAPGARKMDRLYDATALDAVEKLSASLLGNLTPPWTQWFGLKPGRILAPPKLKRWHPFWRTRQKPFRRILTARISSSKSINVSLI